MTENNTENSTKELLKNIIDLSLKYVEHNELNLIAFLSKKNTLMYNFFRTIKIILLIIIIPIYIFLPFLNKLTQNFIITIIILIIWSICLFIHWSIGKLMYKLFKYSKRIYRNLRKRVLRLRLMLELLLNNRDFLLDNEDSKNIKVLYEKIELFSNVYKPYSLYITKFGPLILLLSSFISFSINYFFSNINIQDLLIGINWGLYVLIFVNVCNVALNFGSRDNRYWNELLINIELMIDFSLNLIADKLNLDKFSNKDEDLKNLLIKISEIKEIKEENNTSKKKNRLA